MSASTTGSYASDVPSNDLRIALQIKNMAQAALDSGVTSDLSGELTSTYNRLRDQAQQMATRAGWNDNGEFQSELPPLNPTIRNYGHVATSSIHERQDAQTRGEQARVLLGQLVGWCEGVREAFEIEASLKATADAKAQLKADGAKPFGFAAASGPASGGSTSRVDDETDNH